jgi:hypothetical protein
MVHRTLGSTMGAAVGSFWSLLRAVFLGDTTDNGWQIDPNG